MSKSLALISLAALVIAVFFAGITPSFSSDDYVHLLNNTQFTNTLDALSVFSEPYGREYRPLVRFSLWLNHLMGTSAIPFKITNLLLHLLITGIVFKLLSQLGFSVCAAFLGTAFFALHPIHVTSLHFILGRTDLVAALFYFSTLSLVAHWREKISFASYAGTWVMFIAALLSKEVSVTLPLVMLMILFKHQPNKNFSTTLINLKQVTPFAAVAFLYVLVRVYLWSKATNDIAGYINYSPTHVLANYGYWLFGLIYPFDLYFAQDWIFANKTLFCIFVISFLAVALYGVYWITHGQRSQQIYWYCFALLWIVISLLPISGGNPHRWYLYIPSFGLCVFAAAVIDGSLPRRRNIAFAFISLVLLIYAAETSRLSAVWKRQSDMTQVVLNQIEEQQLYKKQNLYIANIPFGFQSAYLFSFNSLEEAIKYRFGEAPQIEEISYMNLDESSTLTTAVNKENIHFYLQPSPYEFVLLSALERRFDSLADRKISGITLTVDQLADNKKISAYSLAIPDNMRASFYYFDHLLIKQMDTAELSSP